MSKPSAVAPQQKLFVEPTTLYFPPPLTRNISNVVTIYNSTEQPCVFKIHSFEPELYTVKPSAAVLAANAACRVQITFRKMRTEPDVEKAPTVYAELSKKQKFKVRAKVVPLAVAAKASKENLSGGDVWKLLGDTLEYAMDTTLSCNFNSMEVPKGANVTFDSGSPSSAAGAGAGASSAAAPHVHHHHHHHNEGGNNGEVSRTNTATPPTAASKTVSFGNNNNNNGGSGGGGISPSPSNNPTRGVLKSVGDGTATAASAGGGGGAAAETVTAASAAVRANSSAKAAISSSIANKDATVAALEREIREKQALLASLSKAAAAAEADAAAAKGGAPSSPSSSSKGKGEKKKGGSVPISMLLITVIVMYILGTFARLRVGGPVVDRYVEAFVPTPVLSAVGSSRAAIDGLLISAPQMMGAGSAPPADVANSAGGGEAPANSGVAAAETEKDSSVLKGGEEKEKKKEKEEGRKGSSAPAAPAHPDSRDAGAEAEAHVAAGATTKADSSSPDVSGGEREKKKKRKRRVKKSD